MKVIFLDIDGVLNTEETFRKMLDNNDFSKIEVDEFRLEYLKKIVDQTSAKIVLSSTWRLGLIKDKDGVISCGSKKAVEFLKILGKYGLFLYDLTPYLSNGLRQDEINYWLFKHPNVTNFVIFDDETTHLMDFVGKNLIKTTTLPDGEMLMDMSFVIGLCEEHVEQAVEILNNKNYTKKLVNTKK